MDNDIFIPYKFRASQIVGITKVAVKFIEANGLRLKEEINTIEKKVNKIAWYNYTQKKIRSEILGTTAIKELKHFLEIWVNGDWGPTGLELSAVDTEPEDKGGNMPAIIGTVTDRLTKEGNTAYLQDAEKRSSFVQLPLKVVENRRLVAGVVSAAGGKSSAGEGWTVAHTGVGHYRIRFTEPIAHQPVFVMCMAGPGSYFLSRWFWVGTEVEVEIFNVPGSEFINGEFSFMMLG